MSIEGEAAAFGRYLSASPPPPELAERYARACSILFPDPPGRDDAAILAFAARHPWSIAPLDAAAALIRPGSLLRRRILVMAAIIEATPRGADLFLPRARSPLGLALTVLQVGAANAFHAAIGLPLLFFVARGRA